MAGGGSMADHPISDIAVAADAPGATYDALARGPITTAQQQVPLEWKARLHTAGVAPSGRQAFAKRLLDIAIALLALLVTLPLYPILALAIRLESKGPALYRQIRVGHNGRLFVFYKFRSM